MSKYTWEEALWTAQTAGPALANSTAATSLLPTAAKLSLPGGFFDAAGKILRVRGWGQISNIVTTPGTFTLDVRLNSTPIVVFNGGAVQLSSTAHTTIPFRFDIELTCRAIGAGTAANLIGLGEVKSAAVVKTAVADSTTSDNVINIPQGTPAVGAGFDSTVANLLDLYGTFSIANAGNAFTLQGYVVEAVN